MRWQEHALNLNSIWPLGTVLGISEPAAEYTDQFGVQRFQELGYFENLTISEVREKGKMVFKSAAFTAVCIMPYIMLASEQLIVDSLK